VNIWGDANSCGTDTDTHSLYARSKIGREDETDRTNVPYREGYLKEEIMILRGSTYLYKKLTILANIS
jgi:hypothetical protein